MSLPIDVIKDAIILPARVDDDQLSAMHGFFGGVQDSDGNFVERSRTWRGGSIPVVYPDSRKQDAQGLTLLPGVSLFAGPVFDHFGHFLVESTARLWAAFEHQVDHIIFQMPGKQGQATHSYQRSLLDVEGLNEKVVMVDRACIAETLLVPEPAFSIGHSSSPEFMTLFDRHREGLGLARSRKLYASRTRMDVGVTVGETFVEEAFRKIGFDVIYPEAMTFDEQKASFAQATHVAGVQGSALHNVLFSAPGVKLISLTRDLSTMASFTAIDSVRGVDATYLDGIMQGGAQFPSFHAQGPYYIDFALLRDELRKSEFPHVADFLPKETSEAMRDRFVAEWKYVEARNAGSLDLPAARAAVLAHRGKPGA